MAFGVRLQILKTSNLVMFIYNTYLQNTFINNVDSNIIAKHNEQKNIPLYRWHYLKVLLIKLAGTKREERSVNYLHFAAQQQEGTIELRVFENWSCCVYLCRAVKQQQSVIIQSYLRGLWKYEEVFRGRRLFEMRMEKKSVAFQWRSASDPPPPPTSRTLLLRRRPTRGATSRGEIFNLQGILILKIKMVFCYVTKFLLKVLNSFLL